jgi:Mrp family chromosome partitioning ATPase
VTGCLVYALLPATTYGAYTARASLHVSAPAGAAPQGAVEERIKGRAVLEAALGRPEVQGLGVLAGQRDPHEFLRDALTVDAAAGGDVVSIRLRGDRPGDLATLVNAVADAARADINAREDRARQSQLEQVRKECEQALRPSQQEPARGTGPGQHAVRLVLAATALQARQTELLRVQGERHSAEALLERAAVRPAASPKPAEPKVAFEEAMKDDPALKPLVAQIADLNKQIVQYTTLYKDNPGKARQIIEEKGLQSQIDALYELARQQHEKKQRALGGGAPDPVRPGPDGTEELKTRIASYKDREEELAREVKKLDEELRELVARSADTETVKRQAAVREEASRNVATLLERLREEAAARPRAELLDEAAVPAVREERRLQIAGPAGLGGAALALLAVAFLDARRRKLHTVADAARGLALPVAGTQPRLPAALNPLAPRHTAAKGAPPWYGLPNDGLDATRALVMRAAPPTTPRLVTVVSAVGGEGSSVLAVQLAAGLARAGRRTLLVDANLRRPALHRAFGLAAGPGLAEVLRGEAKPSPTVRATPPDRLWVLPAGAADLRALQALTGERVQWLLDQLKRDYEYVVIDGAPVVPCADALPLVQRADAVLVSVLAGVSGLATVNAAWQRLSALGARPLGVVVQGAADDVLPRWQYWFRQG